MCLKQSISLGYKMLRLIVAAVCDTCNALPTKKHCLLFQYDYYFNFFFAYWLLDGILLFNPDHNKRSN